MENSATRKLWFVLVPVVALGASLCVNAQDVKHQVGGALYGSTIQWSGYAGDDNLSGLALFGTGVVNDNAGVRSVLAFQQHNDYSSVDSTIFEVTGIFGTGLGTEGFKIYGGPGFFNDNWSGPGGDFSASGLHLMFGLGYNWDSVALDGWWSIRDDSDYDDEVPFASADGATSFGLGVSGRF